MIVKNITNKVQSLSLYNIFEERSYIIYVAAGSSFELPTGSIIDTNILGDKFVKIDENVITDVSEETVVKEKIEELVIDLPVEESEASTPETVLSDKFICDICNAEFASARGLTAHKNRVHLETK